jgi:ADP-heptose:LPS heptosyltransferase
MCDSCSHYAVAAMRILIIKLDAVGDVLRTTSILHGLKAKYPNSEIVWITRQSALPLFDNNSLVDSVRAFEATETILSSTVEEFDLVINLDAAYESAVMASRVTARTKLGYGLDSRGNVHPFNDEAVAWFEMGAFDQLKKKNARSYQDIMLNICRLQSSRKNIVLELSKKEMEGADHFARKRKLNRNKVIIGLNTGASGRWQFKQWTLEGFKGLIRLILKKTDATILLYGGPFERERNSQLSKPHRTRVINTGTENTLREFFGLITLCDIFITGDTLALHAATALKKRIIALFGPTSAAEIDTYNGQITKVQADLDCLVCYKPRCDFDPNCMNSITPEKMFSVVKSTIATLPKRQGKE